MSTRRRCRGHTGRRRPLSRIGYSQEGRLKESPQQAFPGAARDAGAAVAAARDIPFALSPARGYRSAGAAVSTVAWPPGIGEGR